MDFKRRRKLANQSIKLSFIFYGCFILLLFLASFFTAGSLACKIILVLSGISFLAGALFAGRANNMGMDFGIEEYFEPLTEDQYEELQKKLDRRRKELEKEKEDS